MNEQDYKMALKLSDRLGITPSETIREFESFIAFARVAQWQGDYCEEGCPTEEGACLLCVEGNDYLGYWG